MFNLLSERMQADAEEIITLPESGLALACFKRRAQVSDPKLGTPIIKSLSFPFATSRAFEFLIRGGVCWSGTLETYANACIACSTHLSCKTWFLFTASIASACSAQLLSILRPICKTGSRMHSPQAMFTSSQCQPCCLACGIVERSPPS